MLRVQHSHWQRYGVSLLSVLLALLLGLLLERLLKLEVSPLFFAAVVFSSWYGGLVPGLVATVLAVVAKDYFFIPPLYSLVPNSGSDILQLIIFSLVALLISSLNSELHTAKQKSEVKLAKLQVNYRRLLDTANEGIWIFDSEGQTEYVNQQLAQMLGYSIEQIKNRPIFDFVNSASQTELEQWLEQKKQRIEEVNQQFDLCLRRQDESELWTIFSISPFMTEHGEFSGAIAMLTDITDRKHQEEALRKSEQQYSTLAKLSRVGIFQTDAQGNCLYTNERWCEITGLSPADALGEGWVSALHPEDRQRIFAEWYSAAQKNLPFESEYRFVRPDGSVSWVLGQAAPQLRNDRTLIGYVGTITEISDRKHTEKILAQEQANHDLERQLLRAMLDILPVGVAISNTQGQLLEINPAIKAIWGKDAPLLENTSQYHKYKGWWASTGQPLAAEDWTLARTLATGEAIIGEEIDIETFDGQKKTILNSAIPIRDQTGAIVNAIAVNVDITERKQVEQALQQSEAIAKARAEELEIFMETVPAAVWIAHDPQCHQMTANRSAYELLRLPPGSVITATPANQDYSFPFKIQKNGQDIPLNDLPMQQAARIGQEVEAECEFVFSETDVRSIYGKAVPLRDDVGAVRGVIGAFLDVTERKQTEAALRQKQEWLDLAQSAAKIGSFEWNIQTNVNTWSKELETIYGLQPGEFGGTYQEWAKLVHPDDLAQAEAEVRRSVETGELFTEWRVIWKDGSVHWLHARATVFYDDEGKPLRMVGINGDITERKQADIALQASESRFRRIVDSNIIGVFFGDMSGKITQANDAFLQMVGYTQEDVLAGQLNWIQMTPPEYSQPTDQAVEELRLYGACNPFEKEFVRKDGSRVFVLIAAALFENSSDQGFSCMIDISDRKQAEAERDRLLQLEQSARAEAEAANRIKDDFLAIVSHELRSPLNPILGWSKLLLTRKLDSAKTAQALETIERNAKLQARLIEDLLDVSRILRGKLSLNICVVDLVTTIEAALETVRLTAEAKSIQIHQQFVCDVVKVEGDPNRLQQVVWNLLTNAVKFTPQGGRVEIRLEQIEQDFPASSSAQITISDNGKGISPGLLPHIFDRFQQGDEATTRKFGGLGLGLAIVRHIVELHNGSIQAASPGEGLGATFTVRLPLITAVFPTTEDLRLPEQAPNLQGLRVVIVDDYVDTLNLLAFSLEQYGVEVHAVASAKEALRAIAQIQPDLLLSDIAMPEVDGYTLIRQIRAAEVGSKRKLPAIALTAFAGEANHQKVISAGFQRHLTKPVDPLELAIVIAELTKSQSNN